jgi:hypothetical protein
MKFKFAVLSAGVGLLLAALPVLAHHSFAAEFDVSKPITAQGQICEDGLGQSALSYSSRCHRRGRQSDHLVFRSAAAQCLVPAGMAQGFA